MKSRPKPRRDTNPEADYNSQFIGFYLDSKDAYGYIDTETHWTNAIRIWSEAKRISFKEACKRLLAIKECNYRDDSGHSENGCYKCFGTVNRFHTGNYTLQHHFEDNNMEKYCPHIKWL